jgi:hypothetical protein
LEDPLKTKFSIATERLIRNCGLDSETEALTSFPKLNFAKEQIAKADRLKARIYSMTGGQMPPSTRQAEKKLNRMKKEYKRLRQLAERTLQELMNDASPAALP